MDRDHPESLRPIAAFTDFVCGRKFSSWQAQPDAGGQYLHLPDIRRHIFSVLYEAPAAKI
jgi:hypothetical protein